MATSSHFEPPPATKSQPQKVIRLDFHSRTEDGRPSVGDFQFGRPRLEQIKNPTPGELTAWAAYAAASVFCARRDTTLNDGFNPAGLSTLTTARRVPEGRFVLSEEQKREAHDAAEKRDAERVCCLVVWDRPEGGVGVDVIGTADEWEATTAGVIAKAVADMCRA